MERWRLKRPIALFCSDLDGTLLGSPAALELFRRLWRELPDSRRPFLVYASGRTVADVLDRSAGGVLPWPDFILGGVGTEFWASRPRDWGHEFELRLRFGWDSAAVEALLSRLAGAVRQPDGFQSPFKSSWYWTDAEPRALARLRRAIRAQGLEARIVYSGNRFLDVLPFHAGKGAALGWLLDRLGLEPRSVVVAGDSLNDESMFRLPGLRGIAVSNAEASLLRALSGRRHYRAARPAAEGVIEGLHRFGLFGMPSAGGDV